MSVLRVTWHRASDLRLDLDQQLARGGFLVRVAPPDGVLYGAGLPVSFVLPDGRELTFDGSVLAAMPGEGVAVAVPAAVVDAVRAALAAQPDAADAPAATHARVDPSAAAAPAATPARADDPLRRYDELTTPEKIRLAQHGDRDARGAVLRDRNRSLHLHALKNPQIGVDEVTAVARNPQMSADLLEFIASRPDWASRPSVAEALARNPKTPPDVALRALQSAPAEAVRQIAKGVGAPPHVVAAARKKVIG